MSVLLVNPPSLAGRPPAVESFLSGQRRRLTPQQYRTLPIEHLGLMSVAASVRASDTEVTTVNGMVEGHSSLDETWQAITDAAARSGPPKLIGFTNIDTFDEVTWLIQRCRQEWGDVKIAMGHAFATLNFERLLTTSRDVDFVVMGDGEATFAALAQAVLNGSPVAGIPGLAWRDHDDSVRATPQQPVDLDAVPWPARDELPTVLREGFAGAIYTTRGCLYSCTFCGTGALSDLLGSTERYRSRSVAGVVDEIEYLTKDFGLDFISISDDLFLAKHPAMQDRAAQFADEILRRGIQISFMFDARVDSLIDINLLAHLKRAGLRRIFVGLETGSYEQLVAYRKRHVTVHQDPVARINAVQDLGIEVIPGTIMFHPTVRPSELRQTARLLRATGYQAPYKLVERIVAYAGTALYKQYQANGYLTVDWPIGEWRFVDASAEEVYRATREFVDRREAVGYDEVEKFLLARLSEWESSEQAASLALTSAEASLANAGQQRCD